MGERRRITTKPILTLLIGLLKRTALKAEALAGCCHGTHQGDGSRLPKMVVLLLGHPVEINLSRGPSFLNLDLLLPASFICQNRAVVQVASVLRSGEGKENWVVSGNNVQFTKILCASTKRQ